jgi:hypothetical protein
MPGLSSSDVSELSFEIKSAADIPDIESWLLFGLRRANIQSCTSHCWYSLSDDRGVFVRRMGIYPYITRELPLGN